MPDKTFIIKVIINHLASSNLESFRVERFKLKERFKQFFAFPTTFAKHPQCSQSLRLNEYSHCTIIGGTMESVHRAKLIDSPSMTISGWSDFEIYFRFFKYFQTVRKLRITQLTSRQTKRSEMVRIPNFGNCLNTFHKFSFFQIISLVSSRIDFWWKKNRIFRSRGPAIEQSLIFELLKKIS